jgi:hypothetical protein
MKIQKLFYLFAIAAISLSLLNGCGKKDASGNKDDKKDAKKDVVINENTPFHLKYEMSSDAEKGSMDMYVKGKNVKLEIKAKDKGQDVNSTMFVKEGIMYMVMDVMGQKMGMKMDVSKDENFQKDFAKLYDVKDKLKDYTKSGTEEIIGYKCDVYTKGEEKIWIYQDKMALKFTDGKMTMTASVFEPDVKLAEDFLNPPKDIDFKSMDDLKNMGQ